MPRIGSVHQLHYGIASPRKIATSTLTPELRDRLRQELPGWLREDLEFRQWILSIARGEFTDRVETESRFNRRIPSD